MEKSAHFDIICGMDKSRTSQSVMALYKAVANTLGIAIGSVKIKELTIYDSAYIGLKSACDAIKKIEATGLCSCCGAKFAKDAKKCSECGSFINKNYHVMDGPHDPNPKIRNILDGFAFSDYVETMYRADARKDYAEIFTETCLFLVRYASYKPKSELTNLLKISRRAYRGVVRELWIKPTAKVVDAFMVGVSQNERYHWCDADKCACDGCINRSGGFPWNKKYWDAWIKRNKKEGDKE